MEVGRKVGLCDKKTKIYWTIKGLIILFIKLQFSIRYNQAFRPLRTSIFKHLPQPQPQSQQSDGLVTCIIPDAFVSSLIRLMILYVHTAEVSVSNQVKSRPTCLPLSLKATSLPTRRPLLFSSLLWRFWRRSWRLYNGEVLAASSWIYVHTATKGCSRMIYLLPWWVDHL